MTMTMAPQLRGYGPPAPVPVFQWEAEFATCLELYRRLKPQRVLEIGTYHGGTLYHWLQNAEPRLNWNHSTMPFSEDVVVVSLDRYSEGVDNRHLYNDWRPDGVTLHVIEGDSRKGKTIGAVEVYAPFDWIFIDAGHYLHEVTADWNNYGPMCAEGGVVLFHDILPPTRAHPEIEVAPLWEAIKQTHRTFEIVADRDAEWGSIGAVLV